MSNRGNSRRRSTANDDFDDLFNFSSGVDPFFSNVMPSFGFNNPTFPARYSNHKNSRKRHGVNSTNTVIEEVDDNEVTSNETGSKQKPVVVECPDSNSEDEQENENPEFEEEIPMGQKSMHSLMKSAGSMFGFPSIFDHAFPDWMNMDNMESSGNSFSSFSSSTYCSRGGNGPGYFVEHSSSTRRSSNGIYEKHESSRDSRTGQEKLMIERKMGDKVRKLVRKRDGTGHEEQREHLENISPEETSNFDQEWCRAASNSSSLLTGSAFFDQRSARNDHRPSTKALPSTSLARISTLPESQMNVPLEDQSVPKTERKSNPKISRSQSKSSKGTSLKKNSTRMQADNFH